MSKLCKVIEKQKYILLYLNIWGTLFLFLDNFVHNNNKL